MYNIDAIVLRKRYIKDSKSIFSLLTKDYWKIRAWVQESKTKYPIDIWNIWNFSIKTKNSTNQIESYKIKTALKYDSLNYSELKNILQTTFQHVLHIYQITGERCYVLDMTFLGMEDLHAFLESIDHFGTHEVNIILKDIQDLDLD